MYCKYCGKEIEDTAVVCSGCGAATETAAPAPAVTYSVPVGPDLQALAGSILVRGILGLALAQLPVAGIILSQKAKKLHNEYTAMGGSNTGKAKVGRILANIGFPVGIVMTVFWILYILFFVLVGAIIGMNAADLF